MVNHKEENMKKKILSAALGLVMILSSVLTGCGGQWNERISEQQTAASAEKTDGWNGTKHRKQRNSHPFKVGGVGYQPDYLLERPG